MTYFISNYIITHITQFKSTRLFTSVLSGSWSILNVIDDNLFSFQTKSYTLKVHPDGTYAELHIPAGTLPAMKGKEILFVCLKTNKTSPFLHQGTSKSLQVWSIRSSVTVTIISCPIFVKKLPTLDVGRRNRRAAVHDNVALPMPMPWPLLSTSCRVQNMSLLNWPGQSCWSKCGVGGLNPVWPEKIAKYL